MIYDIRQTTTYHYAVPVTHARHMLRLMPVVRDRLHVTAAMLDVDPAPAGRRDSPDFFQNHTPVIEIEEPHETLRVKVSARVTVAPVEALDPEGTPGWESVRGEVYASEDLG